MPVAKAHSQTNDMCPLEFSLILTANHLLPLLFGLPACGDLLEAIPSWRQTCRPHTRQPKALTLAYGRCFSPYCHRSSAQVLEGAG